MKMKKNDVRHEMGIIVATFLVIFVVVAFSVTVSFFLFFNGNNIDNFTIVASAKRTFVNIILITVLFTVVHTVWRYFTVIKPSRKIRLALEEITSGNFNVKLNIDEVFGNFSSIAKSVNITTEELKSVETLKTDFISNLSHELKTPLANMKSYGQLLKLPDIDKKSRIEYAEEIIRSSDRMSDLVTNILRLNKLENQKLSPKKESFDLSGSIIECLLQFENEWKEKNINLKIDIPDNIMIESDKELLEIVWSNLLSNAFKFTEENGTVGVTLRKTLTDITVGVSDTGPGISEETGRHIFDKFYQGDTSHGTKGNGLGLALVKRVITIIGGEIRFGSKVGEGSTFVVSLPREL